jgi:hypothetical protein
LWRILCPSADPLGSPTPAIRCAGSLHFCILVDAFWPSPFPFSHLRAVSSSLARELEYQPDRGHEARWDWMRQRVATPQSLVEEWKLTLRPNRHARTLCDRSSHLETPTAAACDPALPDGSQGEQPILLFVPTLQAPRDPLATRLTRLTSANARLIQHLVIEMASCRPFVAQRQGNK